MKSYDFIWFLLGGILTGWLAGLLEPEWGKGMFRDISAAVAGALTAGMLSLQKGLRLGNSGGAFTASLAGAFLFLLVLRGSVHLWDKWTKSGKTPFIHRHP